MSGGVGSHGYLPPPSYEQAIRNPIHYSSQNSPTAVNLPAAVAHLRAAREDLSWKFAKGCLYVAASILSGSMFLLVYSGVFGSLTLLLLPLALLLALALGTHGILHMIDAFDRLFALAKKI